MRITPIPRLLLWPHKAMGLRWTYLLSIVLLVSACTEAPSTCEIDGRSIEEGDAVELDDGQTECVCTSSGIQCRAKADMEPADTGDLSVQDATHQTMDMNRVSDGSAPLDAQPVNEADATPEPSICPPSPPEGSCSDPGHSCVYGQPFECCETPLPGRNTCVCENGVWLCEDHHEACQGNGDDAPCARRALVCARWADMRTQSHEGEWNGEIANCDAGDMSRDWRYRASLHLNGYRFMAGLQSVRFDPRKNREAQACALAIDAGMRLTHRLDESMPCYSEDAEEGAAKSNLDFTPAIAAMSRYMIDPGAQNEDEMRHRLWMLAPDLGPVGVGSTNRASCLHVVGGNEGELRNPPWIAWPPPGPVPLGAVGADETGWTIHSNAVNLSRATVSVTVNGESREIEQRELNSSGTAGWAIAFRPQGWRSTAGETYHVRVDDVFGTRWEGPIEYSVEMIECPHP